ncbi:MAG: sulfite exporter TauE/SafE family protein [Candidatus Thorarchaeota archaeon]
MQQLIFEFTIIVLISVGMGIIASLTGISGGAFKTPILIIMFALSAELASAASLLSALFIAVVCTMVYYRQTPQPINFQIGGLSVIATVPGSYVGVFLRTIVAHAHLLQLVFGIVLFPVALNLLLSQRNNEELSNDQMKCLSFSQLSRKKLTLAFFAIFLAGISAGLLGLGGGTIIVPVLCIILEFPIIMAAATSMFTMIFTSSAGSVMNYLVLAQTESMSAFLFYGLTMGVGMILGGLIGPKYASRVDAVWLQKLFGFLLIFPLVKMMSLGHLWLDPGGTNYLLATTGDAIIWLLIGVPVWILSSKMQPSHREDEQGNT